jgi:hypothetical protein
MKDLIAMLLCCGPILLGGWLWLGHDAGYKGATKIIAMAILIASLIIGWIFLSVYICCKFL